MFNYYVAFPLFSFILFEFQQVVSSTLEMPVRLDYQMIDR